MLTDAELLDVAILQLEQFDLAEAESHLRRLRRRQTAGMAAEIQVALSASAAGQMVMELNAESFPQLAQDKHLPDSLHHELRASAWPVSLSSPYALADLRPLFGLLLEAVAVLSGRATTAATAAKSSDITALRSLHNARRSAVKARAAAQVQIGQQLVTSPVALREKYRSLTPGGLIKALAACRPGVHTDTEERLVLTALRSLAQRHQTLSKEIAALDTELNTLIGRTAPHLLHLHGVGNTTAAQLLITAGGNPDRLRSEASFAALCGTAPVPASSGKTTRHRLSRGGDRRANNALHTIAVARMRNHPAPHQGIRGKFTEGSRVRIRAQSDPCRPS